MVSSWSRLPPVDEVDPSMTASTSSSIGGDPMSSSGSGGGTLPLVRNRPQSVFDRLHTTSTLNNKLNHRSTLFSYSPTAFLTLTFFAFFVPLTHALTQTHSDLVHAPCTHYYLCHRFLELLVVFELVDVFLSISNCSSIQAARSFCARPTDFRGNGTLVEDVHRRGT